MKSSCKKRLSSPGTAASGDKWAEENLLKSDYDGRNGLTNGMAALISSGMAWGISTFKTKFYQTPNLQGLREIEELTARLPAPRWISM